MYRSATLILRLTIAATLLWGVLPSAAQQTVRRAVLDAGHRSGSGVHKLLVLDRHTAAASRLVAEGQVLRTIDYGGYKVLFVDDETMSLVADPSMKNLVRVRDDFDLISLNGWTIDTRVGEPADLPQARTLSPGSASWQLYVVQFVGPPRDEWNAALTQLGDVRVVFYLPHNAYLIRATLPAWTRLSGEAGRPGGAIQWAGVYHPAYRISQGLEPALAAGPAEVDVVVQLVDSAEGQAAATRIRASAAAVHVQDEVQGGVRNLRLRIAGSRILELAREPEVVWIEPLLPATPLDERQAQIVAGNVFVNGSSEEQPATPPDSPYPSGYWTWLELKNLDCDVGDNGCTGFGANLYYDFLVDFTDTGFDQGSTSNVPAEFKVEGLGASRVKYAVNYLGSGTAADTGIIPYGHGTLVAATIAGYNTTADDASRDSENYRYGMGVAPSAAIGSSRALGYLSPSTVIADAYNGHGSNMHAVISNNSWRDSSTNDYTTSSQTFDKLVRDAVDWGEEDEDPEQMTIVFAAANDGPNSGTVRAPATAKNVITVGSSNTWRKTAPTGTTSCGGVDEADDARDVTTDSSAGPTSDQRKKPDLVAPGTRITGSAGRDVCDPTEECGYIEPEWECSADPCCTECGETMCGFVRDDSSSSRTYLMASGTSFAAPAVSGAAALVRKHFSNQSWSAPSPALTKAYLLATTTYLTGDRANDTLPSNNQGYGRVNLGMAFDGATNDMVDQTTVFGSAGNTYTITREVVDSQKPFRVVLAWSDAPGSTTGNAYVNDLDLEVRPLGEGIVYQGNQFSGATSVCGCEVCPDPPCVDVIADGRNNTEAVFLPAGASGEYEITVRAIIIGGDGVPGNQDSTDQDFALFIYNGTE